MIRRIFITIGLLAMVTGLMAQSSPTLEKLRRKYAALESYSMSLRYDIYDERNEVSHSTFGKVQTKGKKYASTFGKEVSIANDQCLLQVDHVEQAIYFNRVRGNEKSPNTQDVLTQLKNLKGWKISEQRSGSNTKVTLRDPNRLMYEKVELLISGKNELKKVTYHYPNAQESGVSKCEVTYYDINLNKEVSDSNFSTKNYVQITADEVVALPRYRHYQVYDLSKQQTPPF